MLGIFVVVTVSVGLILGVVFILFIDCVCPPKHYNADELKEIGDEVDVDTEAEKVDPVEKEEEAKTPTNSKKRQKAKKDN